MPPSRAIPAAPAARSRPAAPVVAPRRPAPNTLSAQALAVAPVWAPAGAGTSAPPHLAPQGFALELPFVPLPPGAAVIYDLTRLLHASARPFATGIDRIDLALLQRAQEFDLHIQRQFPDFIEEKRAAIGFLEFTHMLGDSAGKSAFFVTKQG